MSPSTLSNAVAPLSSYFSAKLMITLESPINVITGILSSKTSTVRITSVATFRFISETL